MRPLFVITLALSLVPSSLSAQLLDDNGRPNPDYPGLWAWYDAGVGVNGPGTPANGELVDLWLDQSSWGRHLSNASADPNEHAKFYDASPLRGMPCLRFIQGIYPIGSFLEADLATWGELAGPRTYFFVLYEIGLGGVVFDSFTGTGNRLSTYGGGNNKYYFWSGYGSLATPEIFVTVHQHSITAVDGEQKHFLRSSLDATSNFGLEPMQGLVLGTDATRWDPFSGYLHELIIFDQALSDDDRLKVERYLKDKYGSPGWPMIEAWGMTAGGGGWVEGRFITLGGSFQPAYSVAGGGPSMTPYGEALLTRPFHFLPAATADPIGVATQMVSVPPGTTGRTVWMQGLDVSAGLLTNGVSFVIQ